MQGNISVGLPGVKADCWAETLLYGGERVRESPPLARPRAEGRQGRARATPRTSFLSTAKNADWTSAVRRRSARRCRRRPPRHRKSKKSIFRCSEESIFRYMGRGRSSRDEPRRQGPRARPRRPLPARPSEALFLEEREVAPLDGGPWRQPAGILGSPPLPHARRSVERGAVLRPGDRCDAADAFRGGPAAQAGGRGRSVGRVLKFGS